MSVYIYFFKTWAILMKFTAGKYLIPVRKSMEMNYFVLFIIFTVNVVIIFPINRG